MTDKSEFDKLIGEVEELSKSMQGDDGDGKIEAAAEEGAEAGSAEGEGEGEDEGEALGKSFEIELEDGTKVPAIDGTDLIKSLMTRIEGNEGKTVELVGGLLNAIKGQGELIKSLQAEVKAFASAGKGRKAILAVHEKPTPAAEELAKSHEPTGMKGEEFLAKAMEQRAAGRLTGGQVALCEQYVNMGQQPPADLIRAVLGS